MALEKKMLAAPWGRFANLEQFGEQPLRDGLFSVDIDTARFDCLFSRGTGPGLFVLLSGARDPGAKTLPKFDRWSWYRMFPGSVLCISDPTLRLAPEELRIGWYLGTAEHDWMRAMAGLVAAIAGRLGLPTEAIVCYGSSAGGFGAIALAAELGSATAVAINPQTDAARYSARFVNQLLDVAFDGCRVDELSASERQRFSAIERLRKAPDAKCLIVQNLQDRDHYFYHYLPFCEAFDVPMEGGACPAGHIVSRLFDSPAGHGPEPKELAPELIAQAVALSGMAAGDAAVVGLSIRSLRITTEPVWIDVEDARLDALELHAHASSWPAGSRATALMLFELDEGADADEMKRQRISLSATIGPFSYLDHHIADGILRWKVKIPGGRVRRIGFRLWSWREDIVLENVHMVPQGGKLRVPAAGRLLALFADAEAVQDDTLAVDLLLGQEGCTPDCNALCANWHGSMDAYRQKRGGDELGRTDCFFETARGEYAHVSAFHAQPAMLAIPESIDAYFSSIGDKSRNMVRKATRAGYEYRAVDPNLYIDDIVDIRTSAPLRQGKKIPGYFSERPQYILREQPCKYHGAAFYGVFKDEKLVAYVTLTLFGQLAQINHILGHASHLKNGVMNLLMYHVVDDIIRTRPWIRAINYLYPGSAGAAHGTALFKRSIGFAARRLLTAYGDPRLAGLLDEKRRQRVKALEDEVARMDAAGAEPRIDRATLAESLVVATYGSRDEAREFLTSLSSEGESGRSCRLTFNHGPGWVVPGLDSASTIMVDGVGSHNVVDFLSAGFKSFTKSVSKGSFVLFDFPGDVEAACPPDSESLQPAIAYFKRRFKSTAPGPEAVRDGFKGSDFVLRAVAGYPQHEGGRACSMLLLKKVR